MKTQGSGSFVLTGLRRRWLVNLGRLLAGVAFSLGLGWLAIRGLDWGAVAEQFRQFPISYALLALGIFILSTFLRAYRWKVLFLGEGVPFLRLFLVQNVGIGLNNLTPVRVWSELFQFALLTLRYGVKGGTALATLGMERVLDLVASSLLLILALVLLPQAATIRPYVGIVVLITVLAVLLLRLVAWASRTQLVRRVPWLNSFVQSVALLARARRQLAIAFTLTMLYWLMVGLSAWVLAVGMDVGVSGVVVLLAILATLYFATSLPSLPAAVGTFEFSMVYILGLFGVDRSLAFSYALVIHAILYLPPTLIALTLLPNLWLRLTRGTRSLASSPVEEQAPSTGGSSEASSRGSARGGHSKTSGQAPEERQTL